MVVADALAFHNSPILCMFASMLSQCTHRRNTLVKVQTPVPTLHLQTQTSRDTQSSKKNSIRPPTTNLSNYISPLDASDTSPHHPNSITVTCTGLHRSRECAKFEHESERSREEAKAQRGAQIRWVGRAEMKLRNFHPSSGPIGGWD